MSKRDQMLEKGIEVIFYLSIFSLPINLFFVRRPEWAYLNGIFIDYWAPKLHLSTLVILVLAVFLFLSSKNRPLLMPQIRTLFTSKVSLGLLLSSLFLLIISIVQSTQSQISLIALTSIIIGPGVFFIILSQKKHLSELLPFTLWGTTLFQAGLGVYQRVSHQNLAPYWLLGETRFLPGWNLAWSSSKNLAPLPYGSTPHPNILAAWLIVGFLSTFYLWKQKKIGTLNTILSSIILLGTLILTESLSGITTVILLSMAVKLSIPKIPWPSQKKSQILLAILLSLGVIFSPVAWHQALKLTDNLQPNNPSITRRIALSEIAFQNQSPLGLGFLQHIHLSESASLGKIQGRFLQPVHNTVLLLVTDLGFWTFFVFSLYMFYEYKRYSLLFFGFLSILPIFSLDHGVLTTQSGQFSGIMMMIIFKSIIDINRPHK